MEKPESEERKDQKKKEGTKGKKEERKFIN